MTGLIETSGKDKLNLWGRVEVFRVVSGLLNNTSRDYRHLDESGNIIEVEEDSWRLFGSWVSRIVECLEVALVQTCTD